MKPDPNAALYRMPSEGPQLFKKEEDQDHTLSEPGARDAKKPSASDLERTVDSETDPDSDFDDNGDDNDPDRLLFGNAADPEVMPPNTIHLLNSSSSQAANEVKEGPPVSLASMNDNRI